MITTTADSASSSASANGVSLTITTDSVSLSSESRSWTVTMEHQAVRLWKAENPKAVRSPTDLELEPYRERVANGV